MKEVQLNNGIRAFLAPVEGTSAVTVLVMVKVGSRYETDALSGASHFIEHMMFKGTEKLPTPADVARTLDAIGADYNAYTSKEYTGYYVKCDASHEQLAIDMLYDMTFNSVYNEEEMDRERGVIIEEINMYQDTPIRHIDDLMEEVMFHGNALGRDIAGTPQTMTTMSREDVMAFRDEHYVPSRMSIAVAGNVNEQTVDWLNATFGGVKGDDASKGYDAHAVFQEYTETPVQIQKKATEQVHIGIGFPGLAYSDERMPALRVLSTILGGNMSSRLFMSVREKGGLAYRVLAQHSAFEDTGIFAIFAGLDKKRLKEALARIFDELMDVMENGPSDEELQRAKSYLRGKVLLAIEDSAVRAEWYAKQALFMETIPSPEERIAEIEAVTADQVKELAHSLWHRSKMTMAYIGPEDRPDELRALLPELWQPSS